MPEALALVAIFVVTVVAWVGAYFQARDPSQHDPVAELARLRQQHAWLEQRLELARREKWSRDMVAGIADELGVTAQALAKADATAVAR